MKKDAKSDAYRKPNPFVYLLVRFLGWILSTFVFGRKIIRNEVRKAKRPFVLLCNHQAALDFTTVIGVSPKRMTFVISNSFYNTLPIGWFFDQMHVIPKQQFQTTLSDMKRMKAVIDGGGQLVLYPAGLMCEDGLSTPIPQSTYKFLKWLGADVYVAKTSGNYFCMPKWAGGMRPGRSYMDVYQLFTAEELAETELAEVKRITDEALLFDAYREQAVNKLKVSKADDLRGLENVLYKCPCCGKDFTMTVRDKSTLVCTDCGYEEEGDKLSLLHNKKGFGPEYTYVSDWSLYEQAAVKEEVKADPDFAMSSETIFQMVDPAKHKFVDVGEGSVALNRKGFTLKGTLNGEDLDIAVPIAWLPTMPFGPGKYFEVQQGQKIYRCRLKDGKPVMKYVHALKAIHELREEENVK